MPGGNVLAVTQHITVVQTWLVAVLARTCAANTDTFGSLITPCRYVLQLLIMHWAASTMSRHVTTAQCSSWCNWQGETFSRRLLRHQTWQQLLHADADASAHGTLDESAGASCEED